MKAAKPAARRRRDGERGGIFFRLMALLVFALLLFVLYLVRRPILRAVGDYWVVDDSASQADALIVLSDDDFIGSRAAKAADLYHEGRAPIIVASGRMMRPYAGVGELIQRDLTDRGVPTSAIEIYRHNARDTLDEAQTLRSLVVQKNWHHVVIVTSNYHTRRARYIFQKVFPLGVQVDVAAAKDPDFDVSDWWEHKAGLKAFLHELAGLAEAKWTLRHTEPTAGVILEIHFGQGFIDDMWPSLHWQGSADNVTRDPQPVPQDHLHATLT
jgi:vancomycin permeability regulator SanA